MDTLQFTHKKNGVPCTVVDVRTVEEFEAGHIAGSINIPLQVLEHHFEDFKHMENLILCCASGGRSNVAATVLQRQGIACSNGGPWFAVKQQLDH